MSDNIPLEIEIDIIQRITDTKSLIRCRSVSKAWKSLIDSKEFVAAHDDHANRHLLVRKLDHFGDSPIKYVSIVDDDSFPHQKHNVFVPDSVNKLFSNVDSVIVGSCHGLFCLYEDKTSTAVIWNPSMRKTVATEVPNVSRERYYRTFVGFGVCSRNLDPKLVKITYVHDFGELQDVNASTRVEVFTLSSGGIWRSPLSGKLPHTSIGFGSHQAVVDGVIYWNAVDRINVVDGPRNPNLIMSFNLTTEEFTKVNLPDSLALYPYANLSVSNLRESLVVLEFDMFPLRESCNVWMMIGHGCTGSFNQLYSIDSPGVSIQETLGFRKSGAPIVEVNYINEFNHYRPNALATYEPKSKSITDIGIHGIENNFFVHSYKETLLLLSH